MTALASALCVLSLVLGGCAAKVRGLPGDCTDAPAAILAALGRAPSAVHLAGGSRLSDCVQGAVGDGDIENVGALYVRVAEGLAGEVARSDRAALELGYLIGAFRRGSAGDNGVHFELVRRLESTVGIDGPPPGRRAAYAEGLAAGGRRG